MNRGLVNGSDCNKKTQAVIAKAIDFCSKNKNKEAAELLFPLMDFEWDWSAGNDGDPDEFFEAPYPKVEWNKKACTLKVEEEGGSLFITAVASFTTTGKSDLDLDALNAWLIDNSMYSCGLISSGGWKYDQTEGDNVRVISIDGEAV